ncbi:unnamed protein product [Trifolium pratense]|uniref:Uncharacterized protein n=1 Tax=Trifolium pratense TaxID=57577 RepID=A0ACB0LWZ4_TRIPR|nr:unnamed protein product [Trifolium pratense]
MSVDSTTDIVKGEDLLIPRTKDIKMIVSIHFLHPNENRSPILVTPSLYGSNYHSWSHAMTMALRSKNKLHFINGALPRPLDDDRDSLAWNRCNTMIMSWPYNSVDPEISQSILWMDSTLEIWQDLKERFYQGDVFRISDIQEEIYTLKQGDNTISTYYTKMKKLCQELDNFMPILKSDCVTDCSAVTKMKQNKDNDPLPNISKVYLLLV